MSGRAEESVPSPEWTAAVNTVSPLPADRVRLREILSQGNWELHEASDCCGALALLRDESVLSSADESLWAQVLNLGGFDVLMTPFEPEEVLRITFAAWSHWECDFGARTAKEAEAADRRRMSVFSD
jgi:hypothetical protein